MNSNAVMVQNVSKRFSRGERADSLYGLVARRFARKSGPRAGGRESAFWALREISLEVASGECVGVIGHNGAGKSTLLKLLAGIMRPDGGEIRVNGRLCALIEVGAGFHSALSGRENVYLNASILGMTRDEAARNFDDIVAFSGVAAHIDAPVKHYSSGMHARLGFAIAAHAEPDVLLVDEVLSVGDQEFRAKCLARMREFLDRGASIVFVSHDLDSVQRFCHRTLVLAGGKAVFLGPSAEAIALYHRSHSKTLLLTDEHGGLLADIRDLRVIGDEGRRLEAGSMMAVEYRVDFRASLEHPTFGLSVTRVSDFLTVYETSSARRGCEAFPVSAGESRQVCCQFEANVAPGEYAIGVHVRDRDSLRYLAEEIDAARIQVVGENIGGPAFLGFSPLAVALPGAEISTQPEEVIDRESLAAGSPSQ
ncbi:MAG TPA: ABC transporter ATP-binding protein [Phycisphaerae bacterium]|nr:ABC transporter ATP-binding protein [Phycisphaerae bacterium]